MSEPIKATSINAVDQKASYAYRFSIGSVVLFSLIILTTFIVNKSFTSDIPSTTTLVICVLASIISTILSRRGMSVVGILLLIGSLIFLTATRVFIAKGLAISSGLINIIVVTTIAVYTLPRRWVSRVITVAFITAAVAIIADQFLEGIPSTSNPEIANTISFIVGIIFLIILVLQFPRLALRSKLIVGFISLTALPVIILGTQTYLSTHALLENQIKEELAQTTIARSNIIETFADDQLTSMESQIISPDISRYLNLSLSARVGSEEYQVAQDKLKSFSKNSPTFIKSYAILDLSGNSILATNSYTANQNFSNQPFFNYVTTSKKKIVSGLALLPNEKDYVIYFAVPILSKSNELLGVYIRVYTANVIQSVVDTIIQSDRSVGITTEYSYIIDSANFFLLAHTTRVDIVYKTFLDKNDASVALLIEQGLIESDKFDVRFISQPETVEQLKQMGESTFFLLPSPASQYELAQSAAVRIPNTDWIFITSEPSSTITNLIQGQTRLTVVMSIILVAFAALMALIASSFFTKPITELTEVAQSVSAGDYTKRATIRTRDEVGLLADSINVMIEGIQQSIETLESRVQRRTASLSLTTEQSENRAKNLQAIAEISRTISIEKEEEKLLSLITHIVSERFGFYHVGVFLIDEEGKYAVLRAANSSGGQEMLQRKHSLKVGQIGIVGYVTSSGTPRIALDTGTDAVFFNNPSLPNTRSEMALPLTTRGAIIGALDVQSTIQNAFTEADITILSLLADQIAIAIDNSRLLEAAQASVEETRAVFSEYLAEAWQKKSESGVVGYRQTATGGQILTNANIKVLESLNDGNSHNDIEIPIKVREQVIGILNIRHSDEEKGWSEDEINVVGAVAERLGLALDNARLFEETSSRATREKLVADITTKIRGSNNPQDMIKTAMEELKQALGASKVEIVPKKINPSPDK